jgi:hypothetical protein
MAPILLSFTFPPGIWTELPKPSKDQKLQHELMVHVLDELIFFGKILLELVSAVEKLDNQSSAIGQDVCSTNLFSSSNKMGLASRTVFDQQSKSSTNMNVKPPSETILEKDYDAIISDFLQSCPENKALSDDSRSEAEDDTFGKVFSDPSAPFAQICDLCALQLACYCSNASVNICGHCDLQDLLHPPGCSYELDSIDFGMETLGVESSCFLEPGATTFATQHFVNLEASWGKQPSLKQCILQELGNMPKSELSDDVSVGRVSEDSVTIETTGNELCCMLCGRLQSTFGFWFGYKNHQCCPTCYSQCNERHKHDTTKFICGCMFCYSQHPSFTVDFLPARLV